MKYGHLGIALLISLCAPLATFAAEHEEQRSKINVQLGGASGKAGQAEQSGQPQNNAWGVSLRGNQQQENQERGVEPGMSELTMTVYGGVGRPGRHGAFGPVYNRRGVATELDVTTELETCADGNTRVNALRIGTWRYKMDGSCDDFRRGGHISVSLDGGKTVITTQANQKKSQDDSAQIRCDAASWTCRTE